MKSGMWKSTVREIKQSFGRFMAIFAITALGVSLFAGLKVIQTAMVKTTDIQSLSSPGRREHLSLQSSSGSIGITRSTR